MELAWGARTDTGSIRARNEDAIVAAGRLFAVADGMGGHADGNVASAMAVEALEGLTGRPLLRTDVLDTIRRVDAEIRWRAAGQAAGMGTTLTGVAVLGDDDTMMVFNVGDSRCYRLRAGALVQLTHDHSVVQELVDDGQITLADAERHPDRNVITRSLGSPDLLEIDWWLTRPETGDRFLVCSDGLTREVDVTRIAQILADAADPQNTAEHLVNAAMAAGGRDNISAIVIEVMSIHPAPAAAPHSTSPEDPLTDDTAPRKADVVADTSVPIVQPPLSPADPP